MPGDNPERQDNPEKVKPGTEAAVFVQLITQADHDRSHTRR
jgi:hypothetical protein